MILLLGGGNPNAQDNVRGLAVKFDLGNGASTDIVTISAPVFFAKTPELFVEFLKTVATGDKDKLNTFFAAHPESTRQNAWLMSHPVPASYAGVAYFGVHGFTFTNAAGERTLVKYKLIPEAGELGLTPDEAKAKGPDFYAEDLKERLAKGPVVFDLVAIMGKTGDQSSDPTFRWDDEDNRPTTRLEKSASRRSHCKRPAMPVSSFPEMSQTELLALPMILSSPCGHQPISCRSRGGRLHPDGVIP